MHVAELIPIESRQPGPLETTKLSELKKSGLISPWLGNVKSILVSKTNIFCCDKCDSGCVFSILHTNTKGPKVDNTGGIFALSVFHVN